VIVVIILHTTQCWGSDRKPNINNILCRAIIRYPPEKKKRDKKNTSLNFVTDWLYLNTAQILIKISYDHMHRLEIVFKMAALNTKIDQVHSMTSRLLSRSEDNLNMVHHKPNREGNHLENLGYHRLFHAISKESISLDENCWRKFLEVLLKGYPPEVIQLKEKMIENTQKSIDEKIHECLIIWKGLTKKESYKERVTQLKKAMRKIDMKGQIFKEINNIVQEESKPGM
jgi:hypothetical protein